MTRMMPGSGLGFRACDMKAAIQGDHDSKSSGFCQAYDGGDCQTHLLPVGS